VGGGGDVAVPAYTCIAVPEAVTRAGWNPVLVDIGSGSVNMSRETLEASLTPDTRVVLLTHQFGIPSDIRPILELCRSKGLLILEDAAAALGARYARQPVGTFGDAAVFSFGLTKVTPAGRCGVLVLHDDTLAERVAALRVHHVNPLGNLVDFARACAWQVALHRGSYAVLRRLGSMLHRFALHQKNVPAPGLPTPVFSSCSGFVAALAARQLVDLSESMTSRRELARLYSAELAGCAGLGLCAVPADAEPAWLQFPVFVERKEACYRFLLRQGVDLSWTYRYSCGESYGVPTTPHADHASRHLLGLPTYHGLSLEEARLICGRVRASLRP
jgi:dTDP-4-amino-4,6-dideoxygalactose transaminase